MEEMDFDRSIHNAVLQNDFNKVRKMIQKVNDEDAYGYTPLLYACRKGNVDMCRLLLENGACVNQTTRLGQVSCLQRAVIGGHLDVVHLLLQFGADLLAVDKEGRTIADLVSQLDEPMKERMSQVLNGF
jgi:ankyrin repeat protein